MPFALLACQVDGIGRAQISKTIYNFTDMQDVRLVLGCKAHVDQKGKVTPVSLSSASSQASAAKKQT